MRLIAVGCEYSGVTTLIDGLYAWGNERGVHHHLDDHFTIPDAYHLDEEEQQGFIDMLPAIKERFQRFQIVYHVRLMHKFDHILLGGFHIEEMVYGPRYYYPGIDIAVREYEPDMPGDAILVHLHARPEVIRPAHGDGAPPPAARPAGGRGAHPGTVRLKRSRSPGSTGSSPSTRPISRTDNCWRRSWSGPCPF